jgi:alcohol dehydrogenase
MEKVKEAIQFEIGTPKVIESCFKAVRRGGTVTIVGVYGSAFNTFPVYRMFDKGLTIRQGQAPVLNYIDHLIDLVKNEKVVLNDIISHRLPLSQVSHAYDIFKNKEDDCVKVVLNPWE